MPSAASRFSWKKLSSRTARTASPAKRNKLLRGLERLEDRRLMAAEVLPAALAMGPLSGQNLPEDRVAGEIVIGFRPGVGSEDIRGLSQAHGLTGLQSVYMGEDQRPVHTATLAGEAVDAVLHALQNNPLVEYAEPNYTYSNFAVANDPFYSAQWHLQNPTSGSINVAAAWDISDGSGVTVAVLDTGVAYENRSDSTGTYYVAPDLADTRFVAGYDFINNDPYANDDHSHGTHVAGTIAQSTNNSVGAAGVAYGASVMPVKVLGRDGGGTHTAIAQGIRWAADKGAHIINLSLGSPTGSTTLHDALAYAYGKGATIIAAAGNDGANAVSFPAAYDQYVIAVSATRYDEALAPYSNYGSSIDLAAPGGDVRVDQNRDGYADGVLQNTFNPSTKNTADFGHYFFQGTSMAAPHVSGAAALVASHLLKQTGIADPATVRSILQSTARDKGAAGVDTYYGHGIVDAAAAVRAAVLRTNAAPVAKADSVSTDQDQTVVIDVLANDSDPEGDALSVIGVTTPANGTATRNNDGTITYAPRAGFSGTDSFSYTITDPHGATSTAVVSAQVGPVVAPMSRVGDLAGQVAAQQTRWRAKASVLIVDHTDQAVVGAKVSGRWSDGRTAWAKTGAEGRIVFTSAWQANRVASLTFTVTKVTYAGLPYHAAANSDLDGDSNGTSISIYKNGLTAAPNAAPAAQADSASTKEGEAVVIDVLSNDSDADGDALSLTSVTTPTNGTATRNSDGTVTYAPRAGFSGTDTFNYTIADPHGATSTAVANVKVDATTVTAPTIRIAELSGKVASSKWQPRVSALIVDGSDKPVAGATVSGRWSDGRSAVGRTTPQGNVAFTGAVQSSRTPSVTFRITKVNYSGVAFDAAALNDSGSSGTSITINKNGTTTVLGATLQRAPLVAPSTDALPAAEPQQIISEPQHVEHLNHLQPASLASSGRTTGIPVGRTPVSTSADPSQTAAQRQWDQLLSEFSTQWNPVAADLGLLD